jgi:transcriptional regulator with XRE-family HTH domain
VVHRLEQVRRELGISKTAMASRLGISKSNYSMIIHGQHGISKKVALKAHMEFAIPLHELLCPEVQANATA